ncbi:hypothetical protein HELRODRAFT_65686, partial [Helobdella robusta]|uniref:Proteasome endopeptidase complex n=1 Tax=Helobdella robusta TaxID=6412 RepID=T1FYB4_HELRO
CFAGTAADSYWVCKLVSSELKLLQLETKKQCRIITAVRLIKQLLFQYQGMLDVCLIVGGVDIHGSHMTTIYPHGSSDRLLYSAIGSGSMSAMSVFETRFIPNMTQCEASRLILDSVSASIFNDLRSGKSIDIVVILKDRFSQMNKIVHTKDER